MEEVAVIGMGPAGISAAIYLVRYGIVPTCFESNSIGGKLNSIGEIENYPSFIGEGKDLAKKMLDQVEHFKVKIVNQKVNKVSKNYDNGNYFVETDTDKYEFKAVIIATGIREKPFEVKGAKEINYKGISRCATCDGMFYRGKDVALLGSSLLAFEDALFLARLVNKVYLINPNEKSNVKEELLNEVKSKPNIEIINGSNIVKVEGENSLERVVIDGKENRTLDAKGLFVLIGNLPTTEFLDYMDVLNSAYFVKTDESMATKEKGLFACGDIRSTLLRQVATAVSDGAIAALSVKNYLKTK